MNKVLRNGVCVRSLFSGTQKFDLVMGDILNPKDLPSSANKADESDRKEPELLFNVKMSCLEQYLRAIPKEERKVEYEDLAHLIKLPKLYQSAGANEKVSRVLRLFFENEDNCVMVAKKEFEVFESCSLINNNENKISDMILTYLYSTKSTSSWFSALLSDTHLTAVNNAESIDMINKAVRGQEMTLSPLAVSRVNFDGLLPILSAAEISYGFAFLRAIFSGKVPGMDRGSKFQMALMEGFKSTRGVLIFHAIFLLQSKIINSEYYFKNEDNMIPMSLAMCSSSWLALSVLSMTHRHLLLPLLVHRFFN
ncbi:aBC transporter permease, putative [Babesia ovata]|uniref:ABC transporter permease, putative n=1 Tax=Babesia ovata TaxID=189622 RepID=A0A2H6K950_9APIC|nr:aBC transporter permease, putative [Babesia ovata]GBE59513.1 aBC transporter permease, putative [Babesia ovata]